MMVITLYFRDSILEVMQPEDIAHSFILVGNRKEFKDHLEEVDAKWEKTNEK